MTAFDTAWSVLKAPLLPDTIDWSNVGTKRPVATFLDPITEEELDMRIRPFYHEVDATIEHKEPPGQDLPYDISHRSQANFDRIDLDYENFIRNTPLNTNSVSSELEPYLEWEGDFVSRGTDTDERYRRRGYASALYDLMALYAERHNLRLRPSFEQTDEGRAFWRGAGYEGKEQQLPNYTRYPEYAEWGTHMVGNR